MNFGTQKEKGSGLGLLLTKDFIKANGGRIWLESEPGQRQHFLRRYVGRLILYCFYLRFGTSNQLPMRKNSIPRPYLAAATLLCIFVIDLFAPEGLGVDILYLCAILLVSEQPPRTIIGFTLAACLLILVDEDIFLGGKLTAASYLDWANRLISVLAIAATAFIAVRYQRSKTAKVKKTQQYLQDLEAMLFMTSHEVRKPLANVLGLIDVLELDEADRQQCLKDLRRSATELDELVRRLSMYIEQTESQHQLED